MFWFFTDIRNFASLLETFLKCLAVLGCPHVAEGNATLLIRNISVVGQSLSAGGFAVQTQSPSLTILSPLYTPLPTPGGPNVRICRSLPLGGSLWSWRSFLLLEGGAGLGMVPDLPAPHVNFCSFFLLSLWCLCIALSCPCQLLSLEPLWLTVPREQ